MVDISDSEAINYLEHWMMDFFCMGLTPEKIHEFCTAQEKAKETIGKDITDPNIKRLNEKREMRINNFNTIANDCIKKGKGELFGYCKINRNGGEKYRFNIGFEKINE